MRRLLKTTSTSALLALLFALTFSACSNHKNNAKNQQSDPPTYHNQSSKNNNQSPNNNNEELLLGKVINAQTGQAVANAKVTIMLTGSDMNDNNKQNNNSNVNVTVTSDQYGLFMAKDIAKGNHVIKVMHNGYQNWKNTIYVPTLNKNNAAGPFNGFFMPSKNNTQWLHGVFHISNSNNHPSNVYAKSLFVIIGLQMK